MGTAEHEASREPGRRPRKPLLGLRRKPGRRPGHVPDAAPCLPPRRGVAARPHVPGVRPHRTQDRPAVRDRRDGAAVRRGRTRRSRSRLSFRLRAPRVVPLPLLIGRPPVAPGTPSPNNRTKGASLPQLLVKEQAPRGLRLITTGSQRRQTPSDARRRPGTRIMRISSKGRENPPDRPDPGCCMPGRVHHGVLSAGSRRWDPGWSPVWRWRPGHGHGPGVAAPVAGDRDRDRSGRSPRRSRRRRRRLLGQGPARQVHRCRPQPALRQRDSVVPGSGDSDGDQRAQHEGRRPVPDELTSVTPHTDNA
jgi:hypothetical protein